MKSKWAKTREIAHFILSQLLNETVGFFGKHALIEADGKIHVSRNGTTYTFDESIINLDYVRMNSAYSIAEVYEASNLLLANKHIELKSTSRSQQLEFTDIKATPLGVVAFREETYLNLIKEKRYDWPRRNWAIVAIMSFLSGSILSPIVVELIKPQAAKIVNTATPQQTKAQPKTQSLVKG